VLSVSESDIDVANTLMSLKRGLESRPALKCQNGWPRSRSPSPPEFGSEQDKHLLREKHRWENMDEGLGLEQGNRGLWVTRGVGVMKGFKMMMGL